jgi:hypothetical protein
MRAADGKMPRRRRGPRQLTELAHSADKPGTQRGSRAGGPVPPERQFSGLSTGFRRDRSLSRSMRSFSSRAPQPDSGPTSLDGHRSCCNQHITVLVVHSDRFFNLAARRTSNNN